jgi:hypothetical protein
MPPGDQTPQRQIADRGSVGGCATGIVLERACGSITQTLDVDDVERRRAASERDRAGRIHDGHDD